MAEKEEQPKDLMGLLVNRYKAEQFKKLEDETDGPPPAESLKLLETVVAAKLEQFQPFVDFARGWLKEHPPTSLFMAEQGMGLKLSDGTEITINASDLSEDKNESMDITNPGMRRGGDMQGRGSERHIFGHKNI